MSADDRDISIARFAAFHDAVLSTLKLGLVGQMPENQGTDGIGYGVHYPVFWSRGSGGDRALHEGVEQRHREGRVAMRWAVDQEAPPVHSG